MERTGLVKLHHVSDWDSQGKYLEPTNRQHLFGGKGKMKRTMLSVEILPQIDHIEIVSALDRLLRQNGDMDKDLFEGLREWHAIKAL
jgi:hypothetical protein